MESVKIAGAVKKKLKIRSFGKRLMRRIGIAQLIVMGLATYFIYLLAHNIIKEEETKLYQSYLRATNQSVCRMLTEVQSSTLNRVDEIQDHLNDPDKLCDIMRNIVEKNRMVRSCGLSFVTATSRRRAAGVVRMPFARTVVMSRRVSSGTGTRTI